METPTESAPTVRDQLAMTRTHLANERTLLAYLRTGIMLAATGATAVKLFPDEPLLIVTGWSLVACAGLVTAIGAKRFRRVSQGLD